jgi:hypothetical protein
MKGITEWLASIGLSGYAQRFADNAIDLSVIRDLTEQDLKDLGVLLGHRRKILRAITELNGVVPAPTETAIEPASRNRTTWKRLFTHLASTAWSGRSPVKGRSTRHSPRLLNNALAFFYPNNSKERIECDSELSSSIKSDDRGLRFSRSPCSLRASVPFLHRRSGDSGNEWEACRMPIGLH